MKTFRSWFGAGAIALLAPAVVAMAGDGYGARQYYSEWQTSPKTSYTYRYYYFKPTPDYSAYKYNVVVHYPSNPNWNYFYNPYKKQFWGRCPYEYGEAPSYSILAPQDRRPTVAEIPEKAFPQVTTSLPPIPDSKDGAKLDLPPNDPPPAASGAGLPTELPAS